MSSAEIWRGLAVLAFVATIYVLVAGIVVRYVVAKLRGRAHASTTRFNRIVLIVAALGLPCFGYGLFIEPYRLTVSHIEITSAKIPRGVGGFRIAHISDLHSDSKPRLEESLPEAIAAEHPDAIVFTGDSINSPEGLPVFKACLSRIARVAPTFVVKGNWDAWYWTHLPRFEETGVRELDGTSAHITKRGFEVWFTGVAVENEPAAERALASVPQNALSVFLYHYPDLVGDVAGKADLYLAGHTHGGQVALPFYGALITLSRYGKRYEAGLYRDRNTWLYVNRGIGMEGGATPRVRFWAPPELTIIDVRPE
jgi:predicted MPP superfamily phosphohydrolase